MGSDAAGDAAAAQAQGANDSAALQREFYYQNRADLAPYQDVGSNALYNLAALHGVEYANAPGTFDDRARTAASRFVASPGYQFRLGEGVKALDRSAAARGQLLSGAQTKAVQGYGQNLASGEYGNYVNRLANLSGVGQAAGSSAATLGANAGARERLHWQRRCHQRRYPQCALRIQKLKYTGFFAASHCRTSGPKSRFIPVRVRDALVSRIIAVADGPSGNLRGMAMMFVAMIGHAMTLGMVRHVSAELPTFEIVFLINLTGLPILLPWFIRQGVAPFRSKRLGLHVVRAILAVSGLTAWYHAIAITPLATATALSFSAPIFATVLAAFLLGEKVGGARWFAVVLGVGGMLVILRPGIIAIELGPVLAVGSALAYAVVLTIIKVLSRTDSSVTIIAYVKVLVIPLTLVQALLVWQWPSPEAMMWLVAMGLIGTSSQFMVTQSIKEAETSVIMPLFFFQLVWMSVIGFAFFGEIPSVFAWIGGAMIVASGTFIAYRESRAKKAVPSVAPNIAE